MIAHGFPDFSLRDHDFDAPCPLVGWPNMLLLSNVAQLDWPEHTAPLSIAVALDGRGHFRFGRRTIALDESSYMTVDRGDRFECTIDAHRPVETLHVFFEPHHVERARHALATPSERLLDVNDDARGEDLRFDRKLHRHDATLSPLLDEIAHAVRSREIASGWHDEIFHRIAERLLRVHDALDASIARLPALRATTRLELMRRVDLALDLIHSDYASPLTLARMSGAAHLSPYHFIRAFTAAIGSTPHQYLTSLRIERAMHLLATTDDAVAHIGALVGFDRATSFTMLFRKRTSMSPSQYRASHRFAGMKK